MFSLKEFLARQCAPRLMVSDNAKTFKHTAKCLGKLQCNDNIHNYFAVKRI